MCSSSLVSTHICDALHIPFARIFGSKFPECPTQVFQECQSGSSHLPNSPKNADLDRSWHFGLSWSGPHLPPPKMQIWTDLGTLDLSWSGTTTFPPHSKNADLDRSWHFWLSSSGPPHHPHPENADLDRSWHFGFELVWTTPHPKIIFLGNCAKCCNIAHKK